MSGDQPLPRMRLDKWLWCARFFKTRTTAAAAVRGGKVHVNGLRTKPGREVGPGDRLTVTRGAAQFELTITGCAAYRGPATAARDLYAETAQSIERREEVARQRRLEAGNAPAQPHDAGRPDKRQRRQLQRVRGR